jgi:hypothetical protein
MPTREEILRDAARARILRDAQAAREAAAVAPALPAAPTPLVEFKPEPLPLEVEAAEAKSAYEATKNLMGGGQMEAEQKRLELERKARVTSIAPGAEKAVTEDTRYLFPMFRPTRIRELERELERAAPTSAAPGTPQAMTDNELGRAILAEDDEAKAKKLAAESDRRIMERQTDKELGQAILATGDEAKVKELVAERDRRIKERQKQLRFMSEEELKAEMQPRGPQPEGERVYVDPRTGEARQPTFTEELFESLARQPIMSEAAAKAAAKRTVEAQKEIDRRTSRGEEVGLFEYAGPLFSGVLSTRDEKGAGTVETTLGAALRGTLGAVSTLAQEGYFRGLGYEVDENGVPLDPNDFGYIVKQVRDRIGLPDVIQTSKTGYGIPLPGVATQSTQRGASQFDPEGRRRISGIEVPSILKDPKGFMDAEARRIARSHASGRTFADEFFDSPTTRSYYAKMYGDEDAAFWAGSIADLAIPSGVGAVTRAAKAVGKLGVVGAAATTLKAAEVFPGVRALSPFADMSAAVLSGKASDARVVRKVADKVIDSMLIDEQVAQAAKSAIKPGSTELWQIMDDVGPILSPNNYRAPWAGPVARGRGVESSLRAVRDSQMSPAAKSFYAQLVRNVPDDMVMVTDRIAVPRALAADAERIGVEARKFALQHTNEELARDILRIKRVSSGETLQQLEQMEKILERSNKRALNLPGEKLFLDVKERAAFDRLGRLVAEEFNDAIIAAGPAAQKAIPRHRLVWTAKGRDELISSARDLRMGEKLVDEGAAVEALVNEIADRAILRALPQRVRFSRDLTAAQVTIRGAEKSWAKALTGTGRVARRLRAMGSFVVGGRSPLDVETVASTLARRDLRAAAQTALRATGQRLAAKAKELGSVDEAIDGMILEAFPRATVEKVKEVWLKSLESIYGNPELARAVYANAKASGANSLSLDTALSLSPTVQSLRAVDQLFASAGKFAGRANYVDDSFEPISRIPGFKKVMNLLMPDYQQGLLKVIMEEGVRKDLAAKFKQRDVLDAGISVALDPTRDLLDQADDLARKLQQDSMNPGFTGVSSVMNEGDNSARLRVYDTVASAYEKELAGSAEAFVQFAEGLSPRTRVEFRLAAGAAYDWAVVGAGRNIQTKLKYGYVLPNIPYVGLKSLQPVVFSLMTSGLERTVEALGRQAGKGWEAVLAAVMRRKTLGGGLYTDAGRYFSPQELEDLARDAGLGYSALETERVGTLAYDIMKDAEKAAKKANGGYLNMAWQELSYEANPLTRAFGQRIAEAVELSFRQAVFESRLAAGDTASQAADAARKSALDYAEVPGPVRDWVGRYVADAAQYWQMTVALASVAKRSPEAARVFYKAQMAKARYQDPYGVHGDQGLRSLGIISMGKDKSYVLPGIDALWTPVEGALGAAAAANQGAAILLRALAEESASSDMVTEFTEGGVRLAFSAAEHALPLLTRVLELTDTAPKLEGRAGERQAKMVTDEGAFWTAATIAHTLDPEHNHIWKAFNWIYQPEFVEPPPELAAYPNATDFRRQYWAKAPSGGTPYLISGRDLETKETVYRVFQPSKKGMLKMALLRALPVETFERLGWTFASLTGISEGDFIRANPAIPKTETAADALQFILPRAPEPATERQRQAAALSEATAAAEKP